MMRRLLDGNVYWREAFIGGRRLLEGGVYWRAAFTGLPVYRFKFHSKPIHRETLGGKLYTKRAANFNYSINFIYLLTNTRSMPIMNTRSVAI